MALRFLWSVVMVKDSEELPLGGSTLGEQEPSAISSKVGVGLRAGLYAWCALVVASIGWGAVAIASRPEFKVEAAPLFGRWDWHPNLGAVLIGGTGVAVAAVLFRYLEIWSWSVLLVVSSASSALWSVVLNAGPDGWSSLTTRLTDRFQYEPLAASIDDAGAFLRGFVEDIGAYPVHVRGHPPGATLVPWMLDRVGLGGAGLFAVLILAGWGLSCMSVLVATRAVSSEALARRVVPVVVLLPGAMWATSADGLFAGVSASAVALGTVGVVRRRYGLAVGAGVVFALALMLTYGAVPLLGLVAMVALVVPGARFRVPLVVALSTAAVLVGVWVTTGFSWLEGLEATRKEYWEGVASIRPSQYFVLVGNPGALAIASGPAVFAGFGGLVVQSLNIRRTRQLPAMAALPFAALVAVGLANASLLSKAEVERIWLIFLPWLAASAVTLGPRSKASRSRRWLWFQVGVSVVLAMSFRR